MSDDRKDCADCQGAGNYARYSQYSTCGDCLGTGKELKLADRELFEMIARYLENREQFGRRR